MSTNLLKDLLGGKTLVLRSQDGNGNKVGYTDPEKQLCAMILTALFGAAEMSILKPQEPDEALLTLLGESREESMDLAAWAKAGYRAHVRALLKHNEENPDDVQSGFPHLRDPTSIQLLFRGACEVIGLEKMKDQVFPRYGAVKTK